MRNLRLLAIGAVTVLPLVGAGFTDAQVIINPWIGRPVVAAPVVNPWTGRIAPAPIVVAPPVVVQPVVPVGPRVNPWTGRVSRSARVYNPWTGRTTSARVAVNPWTGQPQVVSTRRRW
jgi:hypothetical protein